MINSLSPLTMSPLEGVEEAHTPLLFFICFLCVMAEQHQTVAKGRLHRENMILAGSHKLEVSPET